MNIPIRLGASLASLRYAGFTLMEVLVALVVLSVGLLGLAALQATGTRYIHGSYLRSQVVVQAYDMADRMRVNLPGVKAGAYNNMSGIPSSHPNCSGNSSANNCTATEMAQFDLWHWNTTNAALLPSGTGSVVVATGVGGCAVANCICTITINWNEIDDGVPVAKSFSTTFQPFSQPL